MLLSKHTAVRLQPDQANIISHMCYAAYKLWNVCNYERIHHKEEGLEQYPDWYYQKSAHKEDLWYKSLPSQTAQEVLKQLDKIWNADAVGAYNILRKYTSTSGREIDIPISGLDNIRVIKVAV